MGFDSPIVVLPTSIAPASQIFSGTVNSRALPFTTPGSCRVRRVALSNGTGAAALLQASFTPAISSAGFAYAADDTGNTVKVINTATNAVVASIPIALLVGAGGPNQMAMTPDKKYVYVPAMGGDTVHVISTATNTVVATVVLAVGANPTGVAITPDGVYAYVTNYGNGTISVITVATNVLLTTFATSARPGSPRILPNGSKLYHNDPSTGAVTVVNTATNTVIATIALAGMGGGSLVINPAGTVVYSSNYTANTVSVISTETDMVTATIGGFSQPISIALSIDGQSLFVANNSIGPARTISVISTATNALVRTIVHTGNNIGLRALAPTPDGLTLFCANGNNAAFALTIASGVFVAVTGTGAVGIRDITTIPVASAMNLGSAMAINAHQAINTTVANEVPFDLPAGAGLGILCDVAGIVYWSVEIENLS